MIDLFFRSSLFIGLFTNFVIFFNDCIDFLLGNTSLIDQFFGIDIKDVFVFLDDTIPTKKKSYIIFSVKSN